jgi:hypothetical protein
MDSGEAFSSFLFFCIFVILGAGAIGAFVRARLQRQPIGTEFFFLIWGSGFGGIPLLIAGPTLLTSERPSLFYALLFVFVATIVLVALMPSELFDKDANGNFPSAIAGAVLIMFGASLFLLTMRDELWVGLVFGGGMAALGIVLLFRSVLKVLHTT